jgi:putative hydroxymethylpyrimidine transport system substrate-binding protein
MKLALPLVLVAVLAAGCGEKEESVAAPAREAMTLLLDYFPNADHAGIYAADFGAAGLDVEVQAPSDVGAPLTLLQQGRADVAITYHPELLIARSKGQDVVAIGALVQKPLNAIISLGEVREPADLRGKRVGVGGVPSDEALLRAVTDEGGVPYESVRQTTVGFNLVPALLSKRVDAVLGAYWNIEGAELRRRGEDPTILRLEEIGVPSYDELVLVATRKTVQERGPLLRRFLRALAEGHADVRKDPAGQAQPLLRANPDLREEVVAEQVEDTVPVFFPDDDRRPWGYMDPTEWRTFAEWMANNELVERTPDVAQSFTNEFLPGEGARPAEDTPATADGS